ELTRESHSSEAWSRAPARTREAKGHNPGTTWREETAFSSWRICRRGDWSRRIGKFRVAHVVENHGGTRIGGEGAKLGVAQHEALHVTDVQTERGNRMAEAAVFRPAAIQDFGREFVEDAGRIGRGAAAREGRANIAQHDVFDGMSRQAGD